MAYLWLTIFIFIIGLLNFSHFNKISKYVLAITYILFIGFGKFNFADTQGYKDFFDFDFVPLTNFSWPQVNFEPLFILTGCTLKTVTSSFYVFQAILFTCEFLLIFKGFKKVEFLKKYQVPILAILFFPLIGNLLGALRQGVAVALFIYAFYLINEKKFIPFFLIIILGSLYHKSMLLLIPIYFIPRRFNLNYLILISIFIIANFIYFSHITINDLFQDKLSFLFGTDIIRYRFDIELYENAGLTKILELDFIYILIFVFWNKLQDETIPSILYYGFILYFLNNLTISGIAAHRINYYLSIFYYIGLFIGTLTIFSTINYPRKIVIRPIFVTYLLCYSYVVLIFIFKMIDLLSSAPSNVYIPYKNFLF